MLKLAITIIFSLIIAVVAVFFFAEPPTKQQSEILKILCIVCSSVILLCFALSILSDNYSQTDKIWSIMPVAYTWIITYYSGFNYRLILMSILITLWGIRLTYNFMGMGGYSWKFWTGHEDYRWRILKSKSGFNKPLIWQLFNFIFIAAYQNSLLLLISLPVLVSYSEAGKTLDIIDFVIASGVLIFIGIETVADLQQKKFQKEKKRRTEKNIKLSEEYEKGFVHNGLWSISRHPNYLAEQSIWVLIFLFSFNATGSLLNFSIIGCLLLIILFQGSTFLSEQISAEKYPAYKNYQKKVGKFLPKIRPLTH